MGYRRGMVARRRDRLRASALGGLLTGVVVLTLAACTGGPGAASGSETAVTPAATGASSSVDPADGAVALDDPADAAAIWVPEPLPAGAVLATGTFESPGGAVAGNIAVVTDAARFVEVVLTDFALEETRTVQLTLLSEPIGEFGCFDTEGYSFQPGPVTGEAEQRMPMGPVDGLPGGDPSFLDQAVISAVTDPAALPEGCYGDTLAIAELEWLTPQDLPPLADTGIRSGATGEAGLDAEGALAVYVVSEGDTLGDIAGRFGVSAEAIRYLNAGRIGPGGVLDDERVFAGEALNLAPDAR
jgi:hypothetical protein